MTTTHDIDHQQKRAGSARVVLAGGGTAGHISPLLAIADAVQQLRADATVCAVGTASGMETRLVPQAGVPLELIDRVPLPRKPSLDLARLPRRLSAAVRQAGRILDAQQATVVVGVGGYVCTPVYLAAARRRIPVVIHEANAKPGMANRVGARFASVVATAFPDTPLRGARTVGMPMRREIATLDRTAERAQARAALGLDPDLPTVVVTGGSSGAQSLNRTVAAIAGEVARHGYQLLHVTGAPRKCAPRTASCCARRTTSRPSTWTGWRRSTRPRTCSWPAQARPRCARSPPWVCPPFSCPCPSVTVSRHSMPAPS